MSGTPLPYGAPIIQLDPRTQKPAAGYPISKEWGIYLQTSLAGPISTSVQTLPKVALTAQTAAIATTPIPLPVLAAGYYRVTYYIRITTPASINSSVTLTINWTESGVSLSTSTAAITGNLVTTVSTGTVMLAIDGATAISYQTAYASNAAGMAYRLTIAVESMGA